MTRAELTAALRERGITEVRVEFSGGNDEGGADSFAAYGPDGTEIQVPSVHIHRPGNWNGREWVPTGETTVVTGHGETRTERPATLDEINWHEMRRLLEQPVYDEYGSFAGDFSVHGTLRWEVPEQGDATCSMSGHESIEVEI